MKTIPRTLNYYAQIFYLTDCVSNWPSIVLSRFFPFRNYRLRLRTGQIFEINHFLSALTIKEVFFDNDYRPNAKNAQTIVDIGANIGTCSVFMSSIFPKGQWPLFHLQNSSSISGYQNPRSTYHGSRSHEVVPPQTDRYSQDRC